LGHVGRPPLPAAALNQISPALHTPADSTSANTALMRRRADTALPRKKAWPYYGGRLRWVFRSEAFRLSSKPD